MQRKKEMAAASVVKWNGIYRCPICLEKAYFRDGCLRCRDGHSFDMSAQGILNLLTRKQYSLYDSEAMWDCRREVWDSGFFKNITDAIAEMLAEGSQHPYPVFDAGCGEGSLARVLFDSGFDIFGGDISKTAIKAAASHRFGPVYSVCDITRLPFVDNAFGAVLNFLSPANYGEFLRVLRPGGIFIKAAPEAGYLRELREAAGTVAYEPEADGVRSLFYKNFPKERGCERRFTYKARFRDAGRLFEMTPLSFHANEEILKAFNEKPIEVTVDMTVFIGKKQAEVDK